MANVTHPTTKSKFAAQRELQAIETPGDAWRREFEFKRDHRKAWEQRQEILIQRAKKYGSR